MPAPRDPDVPRGRRTQDRLANAHASVLEQLRADLDDLLEWRAGLEGAKRQEVEMSAAATARRRERQATVDRWVNRAIGFGGLLVAGLALLVR